MIALSQGIRLASGALFDYNNPAASDVQIEDIATALSNVCRFAGHCRFFYSVAQHLVNASHIVDREHAFTALMHDTSEAFTNDLPTPLKYAVPAFKDLEVKIESAMAERFGFAYPLPPEVVLADDQMLGIEKVLVKGDPSHWARLKDVPYLTDDLLVKVDVSPWTPAEARQRFLGRFHALKRSASGARLWRHFHETERGAA